MTVSMYTVSIPIFLQHLNGLNTVLDKAAGKELLKFTNDETTIAQLKDRITKTIDYLSNIKQGEIDGSETKDISITLPSGQTRQFTGQSLLLGNSLPNFFFHTTTASSGNVASRLASVSSWVRHQARETPRLQLDAKPFLCAIFSPLT